MRAILLASLMMFASFAGCISSEAPEEPLEPIRMNQIITKGTHNSYHLKPVGGEMIDRYNYSHVSLHEQADRLGVRAFELDVWYVPGMGLRVYHNLYDSATTCAAFSDCLSELMNWSSHNPEHVPIWVLIEPKDGELIVDGFDVLEMIETDIEAVYPDEMLLRPDDVRDGADSLRSQIVNGTGWPVLDDVRGLTAFALLEKSTARDAYVERYPGLANATMFTFSPTDAPEAALVSWVHPIEREAELSEAIEAGFMTRTRPDVDTAEARANDTTRLVAGLALGVNIISTDYPGNDVVLDYRIWFDSPVLCSPLAPPHCTSDTLEASTNYSWA